MQGICVVLVGFLIFCVAGTDPQYEAAKKLEAERAKQITELFIQSEPYETPKKDGPYWDSYKQHMMETVKGEKLDE